jgi:hypothetical protein
LTPTVHLSVRSGRRVVTTTIALNVLPLPFGGLGAGHHVLRFSYPDILANSRWTSLESALTSKPVSPAIATSTVVNSNGQQQLTFSVRGTGTVMRRIPLRPPKPGDHFYITGRYVAPKGSLMQITLVHPSVNEFLLDLPGNGKALDYHIDDLFRVARHPGDEIYVLYYPPAKQKGWTTARLSMTTDQGMVANVMLTQTLPKLAQETQLRSTDLGLNRSEIASARRIVEYDQTYDNAWQLTDARGHYASTSGFNVWVYGGEGHATISYRTGVSYAIAVVFSVVALCIIGLLSLPPVWNMGEMLFKPRRSTFVKEERV